MTIQLSHALLILLAHFFGDFIAQSSWMATNKSSSNKALLFHVIVYTFFLALINPVWALVNGGLHLIIDYVTSRITKRLWETGNTHDFFVVIGFDQFLHAACLLATYAYLVAQ